MEDFGESHGFRGGRDQSSLVECKNGTINN